MGYAGSERRRSQGHPGIHKPRAPRSQDPTYGHPTKADQVETLNPPRNLH